MSSGGSNQDRPIARPQAACTGELNADWSTSTRSPCSAARSGSCPCGEHRSAAHSGRPRRTCPGPAGCLRYPLRTAPEEAGLGQLPGLPGPAARPRAAGPGSSNRPASARERIRIFRADVPCPRKGTHRALGHLRALTRTQQAPRPGRSRYRLPLSPPGQFPGPRSPGLARSRTGAPLASSRPHLRERAGRTG